MSDLEITKRGPGRPRNPVVEGMADSGVDDSKARAEARLREIRGQANAGVGDRDKFWAPQAPDGWSYEWKTKTVLGQENPSYQVELMRQGWEAVPLSRHPDMMPAGWRGEFIEVEGQVLMERPAVLTRKRGCAMMLRRAKLFAAKRRNLGWPTRAICPVTVGAM